MSSTIEVILKDKDGFHYKYPNRSCEKHCMKYPCVSNMEELFCNFAAYGCKNYEDINTFEVWKSKK